jgi:hypothetical protein
MLVKKDQTINCLSICLISDAMKHNTSTVHTFLKEVLPIIQAEVPGLSHVHYFSDGAASQYKNFKNFANLLAHLSDFGLSATWNFFATSHGKSPCDGIGGTIKRNARRASLQAASHNQILTPPDLFTWAKTNIKNIMCVWVGKEKVEENRQYLQDRFSGAISIPGTRDNHQFNPRNATQLEIGRISDQVDFVIDLSYGQKARIVPLSAK